jgi:hypothetical protein
MQIAKNAWDPEDRAVIERNLRSALGEAQRGLLLDPQDASARHEATDLQGRLDRLMASGAESPGQR